MRVLKPILVLCRSAWPALASAAKQPVIGFLMVDASSHFAEERDSYPYAMRVLAKNGFRFRPGRVARVFRRPGQRAADAGPAPQVQRDGHRYAVRFEHPGPGPPTATDRRSRPRALEKYLAEGGSVLLILQAVRYPGDKDQDYANLVLQGLGVEMLHEGVFDQKRRFTAPIASIFPPEGFFWTENIVKGHPVTEGVRRLCLPQYHNGTTPGVVALKLSPQWQVLVRGEASAAELRGNPRTRG